MRKLILALLLGVCSLQAVATPAVPCVNHSVTYTKLTQYQFDAMVDFAFNVGCGAFQKSTLLRKVNDGDVAGASAEFPKWIYVGRKPNRGLVKRRIDERRMFDGK